MHVALFWSKSNETERLESMDMMADHSRVSTGLLFLLSHQ
jgi:hypothetical protein